MSLLKQAAQSTSGNFVKFDSPGDEIVMQVTNYRERPAEYKGKAVLNSNNEQVMEAVIEGLDLNAASAETAAVVLTARAWRQLKAIGQAIEDAGASDIQKGGTLRVKFLDWGVGQGQNPPKEYEAEYWLPEPEGEWGEED